jgi:2-haloacid dehalogenase
MPEVNPSAIRAVLFDTFGTVVDWRSGIAAAVRETGLAVDPLAFADAWRARYQPSMEPIRSGVRAYVPLDRLHRENLAATLTEFGVDLPDPELERLNSGWERLPPWPDSVPGVERLRQRYIVGPLSNANTALLLRMAKHTGLSWDVIIGSDLTQAYKPRPEAYVKTAELLRLQPGEVLLAAAHNADLHAARAAGLATAFVARPTEHGPHQQLDLSPAEDWDVACDDIEQLAGALGC